MGIAFYRVTGSAVGSQLRRRGPWRRVAWIAAEFAWPVMTFLVIASSGIATEAEETGASRVPIEIIRFERGASSKEISGAVIRGERFLYSLNARSGQRLSVGVSAAEDNAVFQIYRPGARAERREYGVEIIGAKTLPGAGEGEAPRNGAAFCRY
jgi:hypothetical protein